MADSQPPRGKRKKTDLVHLHSLPSAEPKTQTGWVAWVWPEIQTALATGKRLHEVWEALQNDGMKIPYEQFRVYVSRLRKRELRKLPAAFPVLPNDSGRLDVHPVRAPSPISVSANQPDQKSPREDDPLRNIREQRAKKRPGFEYDPFSTDKKLI